MSLTSQRGSQLLKHRAPSKAAHGGVKPGRPARQPAQPATKPATAQPAPAKATSQSQPAPQPTPAPPAKPAPISAAARRQATPARSLPKPPLWLILIVIYILFRLISD